MPGVHGIASSETSECTSINPFYPQPVLVSEDTRNLNP